MSVWNKKEISKQSIEELQTKYGFDSLTSTIFARRGITLGQEILYYIEDDLRFQHSPFSFNSMEDAVDRILDAKDEGEKVLIFGDRDVDGISATTVLYDCLSSMGIDVQYRLPLGDEAYGLTIEAVDDFAKQKGTLIITVDCGISCYQEIEHASEYGIDVIVVDHHNPPINPPQDAIIIDPKVEDSGYPFKDISGCTVVYKLVSALRFSKSKWYKQQVTLLNVIKSNDEYTISCVKLRNLVPEGRLDETLIAGERTISSTKLPDYLQGEIILVWDEKTTRTLLQEVFGSAIEFNMVDIRPEVAKMSYKFETLPLSKVKDMSKIARYGNHPATEIGGFYNIYVTYVQYQMRQTFPAFVVQEEKDLQLVALSVLSDIMPLKDENRLFVKKGIAYINAGRPRPGLKELMAELDMLTKKVNSIDLSWMIVSNLNATGRMGHPELAADLFITKDDTYRTSVAKKITQLNNERKQLSVEAYNYAAIQAEVSLANHSNKLCVVIDERINRGVSGILAGKLSSIYNVPAITVTFVDDIAVGSMRSCRGYDATSFLNKIEDLFLSHGGHNFAAGFSFERKKLSEFESKIKELSKTIELEESSSGVYNIDAEIPLKYLTPSLLELSDKFEPFGNENEQLLFMTKALPVTDAIIMGKGEKQHLKITVSNGKYKWPAVFWNEAERLHRDFDIGDKVDLLYHVNRNVFNGAEIPQIIIVDLVKSKSLSE